MMNMKVCFLSVPSFSCELYSSKGPGLLSKAVNWCSVGV